MDDDIQTLKNYGKEFTDIGGLAKKISKNWLLHHKQFSDDLALEESDWSSGDYFNAGKEACAAIEVLVPYKSNITMDAMAIPDWVAGFIFQLTGDNQMSEIEQCYTGGQALVADA